MQISQATMRNQVQDDLHPIEHVNDRHLFVLNLHQVLLDQQWEDIRQIVIDPETREDHRMIVHVRRGILLGSDQHTKVILQDGHQRRRDHAQRNYHLVDGKQST